VKIFTENNTLVYLLTLVRHIRNHYTLQKIHDGAYKWDASMQAFVLASFYYGYITTTLLGGILAVRFGGKILLLIAVAWTSALSVITPPLTWVGDSAAMLTVRILEGVGQVGQR